MAKRLSIEDCYLVAQKHNGKFLSTEYKNTETKYLWMCENNHTFMQTHHSAKSGQWCDKCAKNRMSKLFRYSINEYHTLAKKYNGKCLTTTEPNNSHQKLHWECIYGHQWFARGYSVRQGHWCPICTNTHTLTLEYYKQLAHKKGGKYTLNTVPKNMLTKTTWTCSCEHQWEATYKQIKSTWCPICNARGFLQKKIFKILQQIYPQSMCKFNYKGFSWLRNPKTNRKLEIDLWIPDLKIAIEYDGAQHFRAIKTWGGKKSFLKRQRHDKLKNKLILKHPIDIKYFIRIPYTETITLENIIKILQNNNIPLDIHKIL